jgi:hypothetical protein
MLNGARSLFVSGAAHYPRATPAMWPAIAANAKKLGLNMIEVCDAMRLRALVCVRRLQLVSAKKRLRLLACRLMHSGTCTSRWKASSSGAAAQT